MAGGGKYLIYKDSPHQQQRKKMYFSADQVDGPREPQRSRVYLKVGRLGIRRPALGAG